MQMTLFDRNLRRLNLTELCSEPSLDDLLI
jgi:hypothetical protein